MTQQDDNFVRLLFRFYSDALEDWTVETLWAQMLHKEKGLYKIFNIPFYAPVASDDIVFAEYDDTEKMLIYKETVEYSGNSLIQVIILDNSVVTNDIRDIFNNMGCKSEKFKEGYFVIEILADKDYEPIKQKLTELKDLGVINYAEPVLSDKHQ